MPPGEQAREMIGVGVPAFQPNVRKGKVRHVQFPSVASEPGRELSAGGMNLDALSKSSNPKSVVESGQKTRQPRAGHRSLPATPAEIRWPGYRRILSSPEAPRQPRLIRWLFCDSPDFLRLR
jgi:hypothetical protein